MRKKLYDILEDFPFENLPPVWTTFDLAAFSSGKRLWDYQRAALENALKVLWKYYQGFAAYQPDEDDSINARRKHYLAQWYHDNGLGIDKLDISLFRAKSALVHLLADYYPATEDKIAYEHFLNRMGFWMATGSGKTLVLVKLLEILWGLIRLGQIPPHDIMVLTCREDLLDQLKAQVADFNSGARDLYIRLRDLREYPEVKRETPSLFKEHELTVFLYRSDNLSDDQKEKLVDFRNYEAGGRWYVLLDEAHKGDKEESKRQHIYSILARNGFLFNFSATFTDPRDIITTAYDFNLARFIEAGYGKHITLLKQENRAFQDDEDYTGEEKQRVVLKALMMLAYVSLTYETLRGKAPNLHLYHRPLMLVLVNSVDIQDADLKLFFRELERIGKGEIDSNVWQQAKKELWQELAAGPEYLFEDDKFPPDQSLFDRLSPEEVLTMVFNAPSPGPLEVLVRPSNRQELAFKLKTADRPFSLIKIGDISNWLKEELTGYEIVHGFEEEGYFIRLNSDDSDINILMGSRAFYEGWDSNRPNVVTFINIGTGIDARKFILQSVGRGVRIEPVRNRRQRLRSLYNAGEIKPDLFSLS
ncbi:MAG: DEAD/DEAH box helicase family protein, partial [Deltaproteobacteria bacterium]|nr:DEAD/DEAH box helicase family protein [Deltaproteobacteria bacterium]